MDSVLLIEAVATVLLVVGAILVAYNTDYTRHWGFRIWILSNVLWIWFGLLGMAYGVVITFGTYMICNVVATLRNGSEYRELKCQCGHPTGVYVKKDVQQACFVTCSCGREVVYEYTR